MREGTATCRQHNEEPAKTALAAENQEPRGHGVQEAQGKLSQEGKRDQPCRMLQTHTEIGARSCIWTEVTGEPDKGTFSEGVGLG